MYRASEKPKHKVTKGDRSKRFWRVRAWVDIAISLFIKVGYAGVTEGGWVAGVTLFGLFVR